MKNILIPTMPDDTHALFVKLALEKKGHKATLWYTADYPELQRHSFELDDNGIAWSANGVDFEVKTNNKFDVVWLRRPRSPILPDYIHPDDHENARNENNEFFKTFWQVIARDATWVNPVKSIRGVNSKLHQLEVAKDVGFKVPVSLFSNDPAMIKSFIERHQRVDGREVIFKTVFPVFWFGEDYLRLTYTKEVHEDLLPDDPVLQCSPGIYQVKINKAYELRITYFGDKSIAVKLNSQVHPGAKTDWRSVPSREIGVEPYVLPENIDIKCRDFMKRMGVVFGCFDLIVTPEGEYYFLEINEQGQFLWVEEANPEIKMLETFSNFLIECAGGEKALGGGIVSLEDFRDEMAAMLISAKAVHKDTGLVG